MQRASSILIGWAFLGLGLTASAQTTPATQPKTPAVKGARRPAGTASKPGSAPAQVYIKDTAAFRRSGKPADNIRNRILPKK